MTTSKLIRGTDRALQFESWHAPEVRSRADFAAGGPFDPGDAGNVDPAEVHKRAWDTGFEEGRVAGIEAGRQKLTTAATALEKLLDALARPLDELDHRVEDEFLSLITAIVRHVVRREVTLDASHIVGAIREGISALPLSSEEIVVRLHPDDAEIARQCLSAGDEKRSWSIEVDPIIQHGGCLIVSSTSQIDERLETRLGRAVATMFEDERNDEK